MVTSRVAKPATRSNSWLATTTVAPDAVAWRSSASSRLRPGGVQPGVGFVQKPQFRASHRDRRQRNPSSLTSGEAADRHRQQPGFECHRSDGASYVGLVHARRPGPEADVLLDGEIVVQAVDMAEVSDPATQRPALGGKLQAEHGGAAAGGWLQPGAEPQQRRLARPVRAGEQHDLAREHVEVDTGQRRETAEHRHHATKCDDRIHQGPQGYSGRVHWGNAPSVLTSAPFSADSQPIPCS